MGASHCTLRKSCFTTLPDDESDGDEFATARDSTAESYIPKCQVKDARPTLEQWMFSSPYIGHPDSMDAGRVCRQSAKVSPISYERVYSTPRESFSIDWSHGGSVGSSPRRSLSGKRVSFKLPEDADIHIFYADEPEEKELEL